MESSAGKDESDQRASLSAEYSIPNAGFDLYVEWGRNDFSPSLDTIIRYPFHTQAYTIGGIKKLVLPLIRLTGEFFLELSNLESSRDYELIAWNTTFYSHGIILQGYTNQGQWLGAGMGTGGNSQSIGLKVFHNSGSIRFLIQRINPDNDYVWYYSSDGDGISKAKDESRFKTDIILGISGVYYLNEFLFLSYGVAYSDSHNYDYKDNAVSIHRKNIAVQSGIKYFY